MKWLAMFATLWCGGCATAPATVDTACSAFAIIPYHALTDAPDTVQRIREHNAAWRRICSK